MSRSYKKHPFCKVIDQEFKKIANRKVRRTKDVPNHGAYKKNGLSWSIIDQRYRETWGEYKDCMRNIWGSEKYTEQELKSFYNKFYIRK